MSVKTELPETEEVVVLAGRRFVPTKATTFDQDLYMMSLMKYSGLDQIVYDFDPETMELDDVALRILTTAYESGNLFLLLGAGMVEEGKKWSKAESIKNAEFFASLDESEDKSQLHSIVATAVLGFFLVALSSSKTSRNSGSVRPKGREGLSISGRLPSEPSLPENAAGKSQTDTLRDVEQSITDSGTTSSES